MPAVLSVATARFAVRAARVDDAFAIARVQVDSWRESYRGILPDPILAAMNPVVRTAAREATIKDPSAFNLAAYDVTHGDIVGYANAARSRRHGNRTAELFEIYLMDRAKRYGLGRELFELVTEWARAGDMTSLVVWVLEANHHARHFYEAMGGVLSGRVRSTVRGYPVFEVSYTHEL